MGFRNQGLGPGLRPGAWVSSRSHVSCRCRAGAVHCAQTLYVHSTDIMCTCEGAGLSPATHASRHHGVRTLKYSFQRLLPSVLSGWSPCTTSAGCEGTPGNDPGTQGRSSSPAPFPFLHMAPLSMPLRWPCQCSALQRPVKGRTWSDSRDAAEGSGFS